MPKAITKKRTPGLPASIDEEFAALRTLAEFLRAGKTTPGKPVMRAALDATTQPVGPLELTDGESVRTFVHHVLNHQEAPPTVTLEFVNQFVERMRQLLRGLHSHPGRYVQANSSNRWVSAPGSDRSPYLHHGSAGDQRWLSAVLNHATSVISSAVSLLANVRLEGRITAFPAMLAQRHPVVTAVLIERGFSGETVERLCSMCAEVFNQPAEPLDLSLPQQLWPRADGSYLALTAIPSLATYNALHQQLRVRREDAYLPSTSHDVGSGQAQNISMAATSTAGAIRLLRSLPPQVLSSRTGRLFALAHAGRLMSEIRGDTLKPFGADVSLLPNGARAAFFRKHARTHTGIVLRRLVELRDSDIAEVAASGEGRDAEQAILALEQLTAAQRQFVRCEALTADALRELVLSVSSRVPATSFQTHSEASLDAYRGAVRQAILAL